MTPIDVSTIFGTLTTNISDILMDQLPNIAGILAGLIGLGVLVHYVMKWLGITYGSGRFWGPDSSGGYMPWSAEGREFRRHPEWDR